MYAFRVGLPIPPPLAVISEKRLSTGTLSEDDIIKYVDEYQPAEIFLERFKFQKLTDHLRKDYRNIYSWGKSSSTCSEVFIAALNLRGRCVYCLKRLFDNKSVDVGKN